MGLLSKISRYVGSSLAAFSLISSMSLENRLYSDEIHVAPFNTIQAAIDSAKDGDTITVSPGEYLIDEPITYKGKNIILRSLEGPEKTIVKMSDIPKNLERASVFVFENGETNDAVLDGFGITNGRGTFQEAIGINGGGIFCFESSPIIQNNIIANNFSRGGWGGGIFSYNSNSLIIRKNKILRNIVYNAGGGIASQGSNIDIIENIISENKVLDWAGGGVACSGGSLVNIKKNIISDNDGLEIGGGIFVYRNVETYIENNLILRNRVYLGGGICLLQGTAHINKNTIIENIAFTEGRGIYFIEGGLPVSLSIFNNIIRLNNGGGQEIYLDQADATIKNNCLSEDDCIENNICIDPLFLAPENNDYRLSPASPCIDAGDPNSPLDADGTRADIGAYFYDQRIPFIRGDANRDKNYDISDPIATLIHLFGNLELKCLNAADSNADHKLNISDAVYSINYLFKDGNPPHFPFPETGIYDAPENLGCRNY